jgi:hypothetical protein
LGFFNLRKLLTIRFGNHPDRVHYSGHKTEYGEKNIDPEVLSNSNRQKNTQWWQ